MGVAVAVAVGEVVAVAVTVATGLSDAVIPAVGVAVLASRGIGIAGFGKPTANRAGCGAELADGTGINNIGIATRATYLTLDHRVLVGVIGASHQRARLHVFETQRQALRL